MKNTKTNCFGALNLTEIDPIISYNLLRENHNINIVDVSSEGEFCDLKKMLGVYNVEMDEYDMMP